MYYKSDHRLEGLEGIFGAIKPNKEFNIWMKKSNKRYEEERSKRVDVKSKHKVEEIRSVTTTKKVGLKKVPTKIENISDLRILALIENGDRKELTPKQVARGIQAIYADAGYSREEALKLLRQMEHIAYPKDKHKELKEPNSIEKAFPDTCTSGKYVRIDVLTPRSKMRLKKINFL